MIQMKKLTLFLLALITSGIVNCQTWQESLPKDKAESGTLTFFEMQKAFNEYWEPFHVKDGKYINNKGELVKAVGWKQFKRWEWYWENRVDPTTGEFPKTSAWEEFQKSNAHQTKAPQSSSGSWTSVGPTSSTGGYAGLGRINCVAFHPADNNTIYAGAASGGLWMTTDGGTTWSVMNDDLEVLGVSDICINSTSPNIIYIATGDRDGGSVWSLGGGQSRDNNSIGIMKSGDGGTTWNNTGLSFSTTSQRAVFRLLMDPVDNNILYAATSTGLFKTIDGGTVWNNVYSSQIFCDLEFKPGTSATIFGSNKNGDIYRSVDAGVTWTSSLTTTFRRVEMTVSPANANYVYAVMQDNSSPLDESPVYKSTDGGTSFTRVFTSTTNSLLGYNCDGSDVTSSQAGYDLTISADPTDANIVFVGGINVWKSTDGGSTWQINTHWSSTCSGAVSTVHADQHYLAFQPITNYLFLGNDGGLYKSTNTGASWAYIGSGIINSQIYRIGVSQTVSSEVVAGLQDNGTKLFSGGNWADVKGGDGMECLIDFTNANIQYGTYVQGQLDRTSNHWGSRTAIEPAAAGAGAWVTPFIIDPTNNQTLYAGYADVWKTTNSGTSWTKISTMASANKIRSMAVAASNTQVLYVADLSIIWKTTDGGTTWTNITTGLPVSTNDITYISVKADDPLTAWVAFGEYNASKVYQTTDGGTTWTDISNGLPSIPVMSVIQNKQVSSRVDLYAATDVGVFVKAGNADWQVFSTGLPNVLTTELEIHYDVNPGNSKLYAGTFGRGLWVSDLYESGVLNPTNFTATVSNIDKIDLSWVLSGGNNVMLAYSTSPTFGTPVDGITYAASSTIPGGGTVLYNGNSVLFNQTGLSASTTYYYKIWSLDGSHNYSSGVTANATTIFSNADFFTEVTLSCAGNLTVLFIDASIGAYNTWAWDIDNNGTTDYTTQFPTHTYSSPGLYSIKLTVNDGVASITKENLILVMSGEPTINTGCNLASNSNSGNNYGIGIYRFALGNIDYTTSNNDGYYHNYTCDQWTTLELNATYNITIRTGTANNEGAKVYVDYNDNGTFEDSEAIASFAADKSGTRSLSFTTPSSGVVPDKGLRLRVLSKFNGIPSSACDITSYGQAEDYNVYFVSDATWVGTASNSWNTPGNWSYNVVPDAGINAIIPAGTPNNPVVASEISCKNLSVRSDASVTINPGYALTVNGMLTNSAGVSGLLIKSDGTGTGSLIHTNTNVDGTMERYMNNADWADWRDGWHFLSSPVNAQAISPNFTTEPASEYDFYSWYEAQNIWVNYKNMTEAPSWLSANNSSLNFLPGTGYLAAYNAEGTKQFSGTFNVADIAINGLTINGASASNRSWHLLGNPYTSALSWDASTPWVLTNIAGVAKIWNEANQSYSDLPSTPSSVIPATNGFMVQVAAGTGSLTLPVSKRVHSLQAFYKSANAGIKLIARNIDLGNAQESNICVNAEATPGFDLMYDGDFLAGNGPQFYSLAGSEKLSTNCLPALPLENGISFVFIPNNGNNFEIQAFGLENIEGPTWLFDKKTQTDHNLSSNPVYNFTASSTDISDRFLLHFSSIGTDEKEAEEQPIVWYYEQKLLIVSQVEKSQLEVFNLQGKCILKEVLGGKGTHSVAFNYPTGFYVVKLSGNDIVKSTKFINY